MAWDQPALAGVKVIDATSTAAGQFCGRLFADYGAEVILVERPDGAATRQEGPFDDEGSLLFRHLNQGKAGFTWRQGDAASDLDLDRLLREADIVLVDAGDPIAARAEDKIVCRDQRFRRAWPLSGLARRRDRPPGAERRHVHHRRPGPRAALRRRPSDRLRVRRHRLHLVPRRADLARPDGREPGRGGDHRRSDRGDGAEPGHPVRLLAHLRFAAAVSGHAGSAEVPRWLAGALRPARLAGHLPHLRLSRTSPRTQGSPAWPALRRNWSDAVALLREQARDRGVEELIEQLQQAKVSSARIPTLPELLETPQYAGRGMFRADADGKLDSLGPVFRTRSPHRRAGACAGAGRPRRVRQREPRTPQLASHLRSSATACRSRACGSSTSPRLGRDR